MIGSSAIALSHVEEALEILPEQLIKLLSMEAMNVLTKMLLQLRRAVTLRNVTVIKKSSLLFMLPMYDLNFD